MLAIISKLGQYKKIIGAVSAVVALGISIHQLYGMVYDNGFKAAEAKMQAEYAAKIEQMQVDYRNQVEQALKSQAEEYQSEIDRLAAEKKIVVQTKTVKEYVDKIVETPAECDPVIDDIIRMLDDATGIIYTASDESASGEDPT